MEGEGRAYERSLAAAQRKARGIFYTPDWVAEYVARSAVCGPRVRDLRVLDPACGAGVFLVHAARCGAAADRLFGVDSDPAAVEIARRAVPGANVWCGDGLSDPRLEPASFDVVLGNPPYHRERGGKSVLDSVDVVAGPHRAPRMDLWFYFVHRALELLKPQGVLAFIVNGYFTASTGARHLIRALRDEAHVDEVFDLDKLQVFEGVSGRHLILRATKSRSRAPVTVKRGTPPAVWTKPIDSFFAGDAIDLEPDAPPLAGTSLGSIARIRQGIAENPSAIVPRVNRAFGGRFEDGAGVFVLRPEEADGLERDLLRPYHVLADLGRARIACPSRVLIYSTRRTCPDLSLYPAIARHLAPFRPIMEARRETKKGANAWWHLHWPRDESIFRAPKLIALQLAAVPSFVASPEPAYVPFSTNVIVPHPDTPEDLFYLSALLNSRPLADWFRRHAKRRGAGLDISGHVLARAPIHRLDLSKRSDRALHDHLASLGRRGADGEIDEIVGRLYRVNTFT